MSSEKLKASVSRAPSSVTLRSGVHGLSGGSPKDKGIVRRTSQNREQLPAPPCQAPAASKHVKTLRRRAVANILYRAGSCEIARAMAVSLVGVRTGRCCAPGAVDAARRADREGQGELAAALQRDAAHALRQ